MFGLKVPDAMICVAPALETPTDQWVAVPVLVLVRIGNVIAAFGDALAYAEDMDVETVHPVPPVLRS